MLHNIIIAPGVQRAYVINKLSLLKRSLLHLEILCNLTIYLSFNWGEKGRKYRERGESIERFRKFFGIKKKY